MKNGDLVMGEPVDAHLADEFPTVVGTYDEYPVSFAGTSWVNVTIDCGGVNVVCKNIRPANRRAKETVL